MFPTTREDESDAIIEELERKLAAMTADRDAAHRLLKERNAQCMSLVAERDALKAQLDAVPLNAIALYWEATIVDYGRLAHEDHMKVAKADEAVENWVVEVKYGKKEVTK